MECIETPNHCYINNTNKTELPEQDIKLSLNALREKYKYSPTEEDLELMGMSLREYLNPTIETVEKVKEYLKKKLGHTR